MTCNVINWVSKTFSTDTCNRTYIAGRIVKGVCKDYANILSPKIIIVIWNYKRVL